MDEDNRQSLGLITSLAFLIIFTITLSQGGTLIFLIILTFIGIIQMWSNWTWVISLSLFLCILIYTWYWPSWYWPSFYQSSKKENFYTLFTPYDQAEKEFPPLETIVSPQGDNVRKTPLRMGAETRHTDLADTFGSLLLSHSKIVDVRLDYHYSPEKLCLALADRKIDSALVPMPVVARAISGTLPYHEGISVPEMVHLGNAQHEYLFCITTTDTLTENIGQLRGKRIGVPYRLETIWQDLKPYLFLDKEPMVFRAHENELFQQLKDGQIDLYFITDVYPSLYLEGVMNSSSNHRYQLIPCFFGKEEEFQKNNPAYRKSVVSLLQNYIPARYLPAAVGNLWYTQFTDSYWTFSFDMALVATKKMDNFTGYEIAYTLITGRAVLERLHNSGSRAIRADKNDEWFLQFHPLTPADIARPSLKNLPLQAGARTFYKKKGLVSYCGDPACALVVGSERCILCDEKKTKYVPPPPPPPPLYQDPSLQPNYAQLASRPDLNNW